MAQTNPRWLIEKAPADIKAQVRIAVQYGYQVVSQTHSTAQLMRKKRFSCLIATLSFFCFGVGFLIYLFYYIAKKDDLIYLDLDIQPSKAELEKQIASGATESSKRNKKILYGILIFFGVMIVIGMIGSAFDGKKPSSTALTQTATSSAAIFDVPSMLGKDIDQIKSALGAPSYDKEPTQLQIKNGTIQWNKSWEREGADLMVTYNIKTKKVTDFFVSGVDSSGATRDKALLLSVGSLTENDPRYNVKFVEAITPPTPGLYTGVRVTMK